MEMCVWTANEIFLHVIVSFWNGSTSKRTHSTFSVNNCERWTTGDTQPNLYYKRVLPNNSASLIHMLCDGHVFIIINQAQLLCVAIWLRILPNEDTLTKKFQPNWETSYITVIAVTDYWVDANEVCCCLCESQSACQYYWFVIRVRIRHRQHRFLWYADDSFATFWQCFSLCLFCANLWFCWIALK